MFSSSSSAPLQSSSDADGRGFGSDNHSSRGSETINTTFASFQQHQQQLLPLPPHWGCPSIMTVSSSSSSSTATTAGAPPAPPAVVSLVTPPAGAQTVADVPTTETTMATSYLDATMESSPEQEQPRKRSVAAATQAPSRCSATASCGGGSGDDIQCVYVVQRCWFSGPDWEPPADALRLFADRHGAERYAAKAAYEYAAERGGGDGRKAVRTLLLQHSPPKGGGGSNASCFAFAGCGRLFWIRRVEARRLRVLSCANGCCSMSSPLETEQRRRHQEQQQRRQHREALVVVSANGIIGGTGNPKSPRGTERLSDCVVLLPPPPAISSSEGAPLCGPCHQAAWTLATSWHMHRRHEHGGNNSTQILRVPIVLTSSSSAATADSPREVVGGDPFTRSHPTSTGMNEENVDKKRRNVSAPDGAVATVTSFWWNNDAEQQQQQHRRDLNDEEEIVMAMDTTDDVQFYSMLDPSAPPPAKQRRY